MSVHYGVREYIFVCDNTDVVWALHDAQHDQVKNGVNGSNSTTFSPYPSQLNVSPMTRISSVPLGLLIPSSDSCYLMSVSLTESTLSTHISVHGRSQTYVRPVPGVRSE